MGSHLDVGSRGYSVVGKYGLLIVMTSLLVKLGLEGKRAPQLRPPGSGPQAQ